MSNDMKELKIEVPQGYEIDKDNSTFECIKFKPKSLTYKEIAKELFKSKETFWSTSYGDINYNSHGVQEAYEDLTNCTSEKQAEKLLAINQLMNVAKYLNGDWKPDWKSTQQKYYILLHSGKIIVGTNNSFCEALLYFKSKDAALAAIKILGEDTIKLALSTDW